MEHSKEFLLFKLGDQLKSLRYSIPGLTLEKLSELSGISRNNINLIEQGKIEPQILTLRKLSEVLGYNMSDFFDFNLYPFSEQRF